MAWLYSWPLQTEPGLGTQGISHSVHMEQNLGLEGMGSRALASHSEGLPHQAQSMGCFRSLTLQADLNFIYKQDENPSSINLGEQKMV